MSQAPDYVQEGYTKTITVKVTDDVVKKFAELSGDFNPIHMDEEFAANTRFKKRIAHGMIVAMFMSRAMNEAFPAGGVYLTQSFKFSQPIYIDDTIHLTVTVKSIRKNRTFAVVETQVINDRNETVAKGDAMIMVSS